ncbi:MAG: YicC family protein [Lachnospiraceae bacterium]|nr:YicC family protein [Lachnospiraceae bacterium]
MKSMTGFGRGEKEMDGHVFTVEIKTVNHRYLESGVRLSRKFGALENHVRKILKDQVARGKADVFINYTNHSQEQGGIWLNEGKLEAYLTALREQGRAKGLEDDLRLSHILQLPDVLQQEEESEKLEELEPVLTQALEEALDQLNQMREKEGAHLKSDFESKLEMLEALRQEVAERAPFVVQDYKEKLYSRMQEYLDQDKLLHLEEGRLEAEVTLFADRCCIDEELTRLASHIRQYKQTMEKDEPIGRQLDFLTQELNREANTIASKSNDLEITQHALAMKNVIEKIREQVQNIE